MPSRPPRPCRKRGCRETTLDKSGYCETHKPGEDGWSKWQGGKSDTERGYGWSWRKLRKQVLERDCYLCQECLRNGRTTEGNQVDHIKQKAQGGTDDMENLQTLCKPCHEVKTATENKGGAG